MALSRALIKKHGGNLKAAWAEKKRGSKRRAAPKRKKARRRPAARRSRRAPAPVVMVTTRKARRKGRSIVAKKHKRSSGRRAKVGALISSRPAQAAMGVATIAAAAIATSAILNKTPMVRDMNPLVKSGAQFALGLAALYFSRTKLVKVAGAGAMLAGVLGAAKKTLNVEVLAGGSDARTLSDEEMYKLVYGSMGRPANVSMGRPADVMAGSGSGWATGWNK